MIENRHLMRVLLVAGMLATPLGVLAQGPSAREYLQEKITAKQQELEQHTKQLDAISDPDKVTIELKRHFQLTEDLLALMVDQQKLSGQPASKPSAATKSGKSAMGGGMGKDKAGMSGGMSMDKGEMSGMSGSGMGMEKGEMGGMSGGTTQSDPQKSSGQSTGSSGMPMGMASSNSTTPQNAEMDTLMKKLAEHSASLDTIQDRATLARELVKHQQMLDQMLLLMQKR